MEDQGSSAAIRVRLRKQIAAIEQKGAVPSAGRDVVFSIEQGTLRQEGRKPSKTVSCTTVDGFSGRDGGCDASGGKRDAANASDGGEGLAGSFASREDMHAARLSDGDAAERAFRKIERLSCVREQSSTALRRRLIREGFSEDDVQAAIGRALACGLVDDGRYAEVLVRSRLSQGRGRRGIEAELDDAGIGADEAAAIVDAALDDGYGQVGREESEVERALALLDRRPPRSKNLREGAYRRLVQKGYSSSVASSVARQWCERQEAEDS